MDPCTSARIIFPTHSTAFVDRVLRISDDDGASVSFFCTALVQEYCLASNLHAFRFVLMYELGLIMPFLRCQTEYICGEMTKNSYFMAYDRNQFSMEENHPNLMDRAIVCSQSVMGREARDLRK